MSETNLRRTDVYWMGGSPCAGKSSMAQILAEQTGVRLYHVDEELRHHVPHLTPARQPVLYKWTHTPWNDLWMQPAGVLLAEVIAAYTEHCALVLEDVATLSATLSATISATAPRLLVEGTALLPTCIADQMASPRHGIWVVPDEAFQRAHYPARGAWVQSILGQCQDPDQALRNWMDRDVAFARWVAAEAAQRGFRVMRVDGSRSIAAGAAEVAAHFGWSTDAPSS